MTTIVLIVPFLVKLAVSGIKRFPVIRREHNQTKRDLVLRLLVAVLSFAGIIGSYMATGVAPEEALVEETVSVIVFTVLAILGSFGVHEVTKK